MEEEKDMVVLIHKHLTHQLLPEENLQLEEWLKEDTDHRELYQDIKFAWEHSRQRGLEVSEEEIEQELSLLQQRISVPKKGKEMPFLSLKILQYAAVVVLLVLGSWVIFQLNNTERETETFAVVYNENPNVTLPDSSLVSLQPSSRISYQMEGEERKVELSGEAYFDVARDEERPFWIFLEQGASIKVLGTSFLVRAYPGEPLQVLVTSGLVELSYEDKIVRLKKGEEGILDQEKRLVKRDVMHPNILAWKTNVLTFDNAPLKNVFQDLEKYYDVAFRIENPEILSCKYTGSFRELALKDLLEILSYSIPLGIKEEGDGKFRVYGKKCNQG